MEELSITALRENKALLSFCYAGLVNETCPPLHLLTFQHCYSLYGLCQPLQYFKNNYNMFHTQGPLREEDRAAPYEAPSRSENRMPSATLPSNYQYDAQSWSYGWDNGVMGGTGRPGSLSRRAGLPTNWNLWTDPQIQQQSRTMESYEMNGQFSSQATQEPQCGSLPVPELENDDLIPTALVMKNIPFAVQKAELVNIMSDLQLPVPYAFNYHFDNGVFRGLAFANFTTPEETKLVIDAMNHMELQGRKLRVEYKRMLPAKERERIEREKRERRGQLQEEHPSMVSYQAHYSLHRQTSTASFTPIDIDLNDPVTLRFYNELLVFKNSDRETLSFPSTVSPADRRIIHTLAHHMALEHWSEGEEETPFVRVSRQRVHSLSLHRASSTGELYRRRDSASRQSPRSGMYSGYAGSNHSATSIRSHGSNDSYTCSVRSARGIPDPDSDTRYSGLEQRSRSVGNNASPRDLSPLEPRRRSTHEINGNGEAVESSGENYQTWEEFCVLQLVAFLQVCTLDDVHTLTQSPTLLGKRFILYLKRMISQEGKTDFLSYRASPRPGQPEAQLQLLHQKSFFSQSRTSIRSYSSRTSQSSTSTASSFSSQISDGTTLNHVQQEAKSLHDCLAKIQKKLKHLEKELQGIRISKGQDHLAAELQTLAGLVETIKTAIEWLRSNEEDLGLLGFSDVFLLFAKFHREFVTFYKELQKLKRQNRASRVLRPGRAKHEGEERRLKYVEIEQALNHMKSEIVADLEAAEIQKAAFIAAGNPYASDSISEAVADLGYAPHDTFAGSFLMTRQFIKIDDPRRFQGFFICECCPKKPKKFETAEELR
ncbi:uncharacterized protein LY89DRAFT_412547 [Mollisia scopiformis]|uniref:R3H domain-containing protein n=1 Tax=Mollisia scopiformis TaxID=149040 RepID=A0A132B3Q1_MOLSC|nr:uncharacterized protein LY89DRAFT_412547 [Mollisia scopiformis]KUJ06297.1 hypothetical protein LY89DRAFT_412547 [Mollisia scopiformis]